MGRTNTCKQARPSEEADHASSHGDFALNVAIIYQGVGTLDWAMQVVDHAAQPLTLEAVRSTAWSVSDLDDPRVLQEAVASAIRADAVVVSVRADGMLPQNLCSWIESWLPQRSQPTGALVALIGISEESIFQSCMTLEYLGDIARDGRLDFLPNIRALHLESGISQERIAKRAPPTKDKTPTEHYEH
jgi:hypothetical protein